MGLFTWDLNSSVILFVLAIWYIIKGGSLQLRFSARAFVPDFAHLNTLVVFVSFVLAYMGVEASASHINELKRPKRNYPLAMFILVILAICLDTFDGFTVAAVVQPRKFHLVRGLSRPLTTCCSTSIPNSAGWSN